MAEKGMRKSIKKGKIGESEESKDKMIDFVK